MGPISSTFTVGHCYYDSKVEDKSPKVMRYKESITYGMQLVPYSGLLKFPVSCDSEEVRNGTWVSCMEQVERSEAIHNCDGCPLISITKNHVGTVVAFQKDGKMSSPHFLYVYVNGITFLMELDGDSRIFNLRISQCYPLQGVYKNIAKRAVSSDPLRSSIFDNFFKQLRGTNQYNSFASMVYGASLSTEAQEAMIRLFELMNFEGITADTFKAEVDKRYSSLSNSSKDFDSKYEVVLVTYESLAREYSQVEREVMRTIGFQYETSQETQEAEDGDRPFPRIVTQIVPDAPPTPGQYIYDRIGLYNGNATGFWFSSICPALNDFPDFDTDYKGAIKKHLELRPGFGERRLGFIKEDDKEAVSKKLLLIKKLGKEDPFRVWTKDPPEAFRAYEWEHLQMFYVEIFKEVYPLYNEA